MIALEIVEDKKSRKPATDLTKMVRKLAHQRGVMIEVGGHHNNVARLLPPLIISEDLLMKAADVLEGVLKELE
jgi:4-aminobutyrate aminotransferase-like enzyme